MTQTGERRLTVLVVEDEALVLTTVRELVLAFGYRVLGAASAAEALRLCRERLDPIDLLLADVGLPGMTGPELADQVRQLCPGIQVAFMSGLSDDQLSQAGVHLGDPLLLRKPFGHELLVGMVRQALGQPRPEP